MPLPRGNNVLDYSRWQQNLIGVLQPNIAYQTNLVVEPHTVLTLDARLAYRNKGDADNDWKYYKSALENRHLDCTADSVSEMRYSLLRKDQFDSMKWLLFVLAEDRPVSVHVRNDSAVRTGIAAPRLLFAERSSAGGHGAPDEPEHWQHKRSALVCHLPEWR